MGAVVNVPFSPISQTYSLIKAFPFSFLMILTTALAFHLHCHCFSSVLIHPELDLSSRLGFKSLRLHLSHSSQCHFSSETTPSLLRAPPITVQILYWFSTLLSSNLSAWQQGPLRPVYCLSHIRWPLFPNTSPSC